MALRETARRPDGHRPRATAARIQEAFPVATVSGKKQVSRGSQTLVHWGSGTSSTFTYCVTLSQSLNLSEPHSALLQNGAGSNAGRTGHL